MRFNRSTLYYKPKGESEENLRIMEMMDKYDMDHSTAGVQTMVNMLALKGIVFNQKRVRRLLRLMGINAIYPKKCLSRGGCSQYTHPYLPRGMEVERPNQV